MHAEGNDEAGAAAGEPLARRGAASGGGECPGGEGQPAEQGDGGTDQAWSTEAKPDGDAMVPWGHLDEQEARLNGLGRDPWGGGSRHRVVIYPGAPAGKGELMEGEDTLFVPRDGDLGAGPEGAAGQLPDGQGAVPAGDTAAKPGSIGEHALIEPEATGFVFMPGGPVGGLGHELPGANVEPAGCGAHCCVTSSGVSGMVTVADMPAIPRPTTAKQIATQARRRGVTHSIKAPPAANAIP